MLNDAAIIGKIAIGGDFRASSVFVGVDAGSDGLLGTGDDTKVMVMHDVAAHFSGIASLIVKGQAIGTTASGDVFASAGPGGAPSDLYLREITA